MGYGYAGPYGGHMGYGYGGNMMYGYGGWIMWLIILVLAGLAIYFLVMQTRHMHSSQWRSPQEGHSGETALDILKKRFARGEITKEEFENMKKDLQ